jgi:hypothetical protein
MTLFNGQVDTIGKFWWIDIKKPMEGNKVAIRALILELAHKKKKLLIVNCPGCQEVIDPKVWKKEGEKIYRVFMRPDEPMVLYERAVKLNPDPKPKEAFQFA